MSTSLQHATPAHKRVAPDGGGEGGGGEGGGEGGGGEGGGGNGGGNGGGGVGGDGGEGGEGGGEGHMLTREETPARYTLWKRSDELVVKLLQLTVLEILRLKLVVSLK